MAKKIFSTEITESVLSAFTKYTCEHGYIKYRAVEAAMKAFMALPPAVQSRLMNEDYPQKKVLQFMTESLLDAEIQKQLDDLGPARAEFLNLLWQAKEKASAKK